MKNENRSYIRLRCSRIYNSKHKFYDENPEQLYKDLFKVYYSERSGDDLKNWKDGEKWSKEYEREKKRRNSLYHRFALLKGIVHEIKTNRHAFSWSENEKDWARQMIKALDFDGKDETKVIVCVIVMTKLFSNPNRRLEDYYNLLREYNISYGYVYNIRSSLPDKFLTMNRESGEMYEGESAAYNIKDNGELELFLSADNGKVDNLTYDDGTYGNDYSESENTDCSWEEPDLIE